MAKFYGKIGFVETIETSPDIWETVETPKSYVGELNRNQRRWEQGSEANSNLSVNNEVSILADRFALENLNAMKWVEVMGSKWKITSVSISYPRIDITIGGVYNGG